LKAVDFHDGFGAVGLSGDASCCRQRLLALAF
jgi:hypothetical protein